MPRRTGMVIDKTYKQAMGDVAAGLALKESARCIRLLPSAEGVQWRSRRSGSRREGGPIVRQMEHLVTEQENSVRCEPGKRK